MLITTAGITPITAFNVLPAALVSSVYSSVAALGYSVSASFSLLALRTRARALDRAGAAWTALGWTSHSVLLGADAARLLWT